MLSRTGSRVAEESVGAVSAHAISSERVEESVGAVRSSSEATLSERARPNGSSSRWVLSDMTRWWRASPPEKSP
jgi:hypothetical protein